MEETHDRQPSEECDWEKVSPVSMPLSLAVIEVNTSAGVSKSDTEITFTVEDNQPMPKGVPVLVPVGWLDRSGDIGSYPLGTLFPEECKMFFRNEDIASLDRGREFQVLVSVDADILGSSDYFRLEPTSASVSTQSSRVQEVINQMLTSHEDWDDGLVICGEDQRVVDALNEEITVAREQIAQLTLAAEDGKAREVALTARAKEAEQLLLSAGLEMDNMQATMIEVNNQKVSAQEELQSVSAKFERLLKEEQAQKNELKDWNNAAQRKIDELKVQLGETAAEFGKNLQAERDRNDSGIENRMQEMKARLSAEHAQALDSLEAKTRSVLAENATLRNAVETVSNEYEDKIKYQTQEYEKLKQACTALAERVKTLSGEKVANQISAQTELLTAQTALEEQKVLAAQGLEYKSKIQVVAQRLQEVSRQYDQFKKQNAEMLESWHSEQGQVSALKETVKGLKDKIRELEEESREKDEHLGRLIQDAESAKGSLDRGLGFWSEFKRQVDTVVTVLQTEKDCVSKQGDGLEAKKRAQRSLDLCYRTLRKVKDELDDFEPHLKTPSDETATKEYLPFINSDASTLSRDKLLILVDDLKARIREAYEDYTKVSKERNELRKQVEGGGKAAMPIIKKSEGDYTKWLKSTADGGNDAIFAGILDCRTATGVKQCILPTFFKGACGEKSEFAIEDLAKGNCASCPSKNKEIEIWLRTAPKGANLSRSNFVDVSSSFSYKPLGTKQQGPFDPDEDLEEFHDAHPCPPSTQAASVFGLSSLSSSSVPAHTPPTSKRYNCQYCTSIFECYQKDAYEEHMQLHTMYGKNDGPADDDPFNFGF